MGTRINLILSVLLLSICSIAQETVKYEAVINIDTITEEKELLKRLKIWLNEAFIDEKEVIQVMDEEEGQIIGKGNLRYNSKIFMGSDGTSGRVDFRMKIEIKKGRYRYEFFDFIHYGSDPMPADFGLLTTDSICSNPPKGNPQNWSNKVWNDIKTQTEDQMLIIISSLIRYMEMPTRSETEEW